MKKVVLGKTGITTIQNAFGALPIQRVSDEYAVKLLRRAYEGGFTFFDTARAYSDSERKIGLAFSDMRDKITIASKTMSVTPEGIKRDLEASLKFLNTDYIDIYQVHNPAFCPKLNDGTGVYETLLEAKKEGKIRHIGLTNHRLHIAREAVESGLYETLQFPFCYLATDKEIELVKLCKEHNVGFVAMKALSGGLITNSAAAYAYISQFDNVLPIWGIQRDSELEEFISYISDTPEMNAKMTEMIEKDRKELLGDFCRGCGYCMPCPVGIEINNSARMSQLIRRSPSQNWLTPEWQEKMLKIESCLNCNKCASQCPYGLDTPALLRRNLEDYKNIISGKTKI